ncbi:ABC transporter permease subunit [Phytomonospora sp. NPDC050363]|uniref:ABC transporter permease n=1 Tax=Phytomonospora sp. NPDC050363 TaxID=3155642 RepID=UPI0033C26A70
MSAAEGVSTVDAGWAPRRRFSTRFLRSEMGLIARRRRNQAGLAVLAVIPVIIAVVMAATRPAPGSGPPLFTAMLDNGLITVLAGLSIEMSLFLPLAVSILAGDAIAGEASTGTLRYLLTVPAGRVRLLAVKFGGIVAATFAAVGVIALTGAVMGVALFGTGDMVTLSGTTLPFGEALGRVGIAVLYVVMCLVAVAAIGLFVSTLTEQPIGAAVAMLMFIVLSQILGALDDLDWLHPFLITNYWSSWADLLRDPPAWDQMLLGAVSAAVWTAFGLSAAWARLTTKDITS